MASPPRATTDVQAANLALGLVTEPPISSFDEADRTAARECKKWYGTALDKALSRTDWNFASAWDRPAQNATVGLGKLTKVYPLRSDCVKVRQVFEGEPSDDTALGTDEWAIESAEITTGGTTAIAKVLVCEIDNPTIRYTRRVDNVALWDGEFLVAFVHRLARYVAPKLGKSQSAIAEIKQEADDEADNAAGADARETAPKQISRDVSWIRARRGLRGA